MPEPEPTRIHAGILATVSEDFDELGRLYPDVPTYLADLGRAYRHPDQVLTGKKDLGGAREAADRSVGCLRAALESSPRCPDSRVHLWYAFVNRAIIGIELREIAGVAEAAEELPGLWPENPSSYVQAAWFLIRCAEVSPDRRSALYDRAIGVLRLGVDRRILDWKALDDPPAPNAFREREAFRLSLSLGADAPSRTIPPLRGFRNRLGNPDASGHAPSQEAGSMIADFLRRQPHRTTDLSVRAASDDAGCGSVPGEDAIGTPLANHLTFSAGGNARRSADLLSL